MNKAWKNTQNEITVLMALDTLGMCYIARDESGEIWAYENEPEKASFINPEGEECIITPIEWHDLSAGNDLKLTAHKHFFDEVNAEDEEATKIEVLMMNKIRGAADPAELCQWINENTGMLFDRAIKKQDVDIFDR